MFQRKLRPRLVLNPLKRHSLVMPIIKFVNENKEIEVPNGANLRAEAVRAGINVNHMVCGVSEGVDAFAANAGKVLNCRGFGLCGTCRVLVTSGAENVNSMTTREQMKFKYAPLPDPMPAMAFIGHEDSMRLACMTQVHGDIEVETMPEMNMFGENFFS